MSIGHIGTNFRATYQLFLTKILWKRVLQNEDRFLHPSVILILLVFCLGYRISLIYNWSTFDCIIVWHSSEQWQFFKPITIQLQNANLSKARGNVIIWTDRTCSPNSFTGRKLDPCTITVKQVLYNQGICSLSVCTYYRKTWWSFEAARVRFKLFQSLWNLTATAAEMPV